MKVIIAGSRTITDPALLEQVMAYVQAHGVDVTEVVHGGARGVDALADQWARKRGIGVTRFEADWSRYGRAAGPIRNAAMAAYGDMCVFLWDGVSAGTRSMINEAGALNLRSYIYIWTGKAWKQGYAPTLSAEAQP